MYMPYMFSVYFLSDAVSVSFVLPANQGCLDGYRKLKKALLVGFD